MSRGGVGARRGLLRLALGGHQAAPFASGRCLPHACRTLQLFDSFLDGWNGVQLRLRPMENATALAPSAFGLTKGGFATARVCGLARGACYQSELVGGTGTAAALAEASWAVEGCGGGAVMVAQIEPRFCLSSEGGCELVFPSPPAPPQPDAPPQPPPPLPPPALPFGNSSPPPAPPSLPS